MLILIANALVYLLTFRLTWKRSPYLNFGTSLSFLYAIVAVTCVATYSMELQEFKLTLWPFIYLYFAFLLAIHPLLFGNNVQISTFSIKNKKLCDLILIIMLIAGIGNLFYSLSATVDVIVKDQIAEIYGDKNDQATSVNTIDWLCKNINNYGVIPFSLIVFNYFTEKNKKRIRLAILAFFIVFVSLFTTSAIRALRWNMFSDLIALTSGYLVFYNAIPNSRRKFINTLLGSTGIVIASFFVIVAISRYSFSYSAYGGDSNASLIFYLGHSMMVFCYGIVDTIHDYMGGAYFWGVPFSKNIGLHSGGDFPTVIGNFYVDFGPYLTLMICALIGLFFKKHLKIRSIADAFLVIYYFKFMAMGIFSQPFGYGVALLINIIIYFLLKILLKR